MSSYTEKVIIPFGGLELLNIPIEEVYVKVQAAAGPDFLLVKELWLRPRQWAKRNLFSGLLSAEGEYSLSNSETLSPSDSGLG